MREILFRGRDKEGHWNFGNLAHLRCEVRGEVTTEIFKIHPIKINGAEYPTVVDPDTVGQFTGRYDKNGIKIFENDLVKIPNGTIWNIIWDSDDSRYLMDGFDGMKYAKYAFGFASSQLEVIGNIHDGIEKAKT